jgi:hypothetical protein
MTNPPATDVPALAAVDPGYEDRGSWIPTGGMIATRFMELRKRRGLMITVIVLNVYDMATSVDLRDLSLQLGPGVPVFARVESSS